MKEKDSIYDRLGDPLLCALKGKFAFVREEMENVLQAQGLGRPEQIAYIDGMLGRMDKHSFPLPPMFFDFERATRIHARMEGLDLDAAKAALRADPAAYLEVHDIQNAETLRSRARPAPSRAERPNTAASAQEPPKRKKHGNAVDMPDDATIIRCAMQMKADTGRLPSASQSYPGNGGLPDGAPSWATIVNKLREERGTTLGVMVRMHMAEERAAAKAAPSPSAP